MATVHVDSRLRMRGSELPAGVFAELKAACEHENMALAAKRHMGIPTWGEEKVIRTWRWRGDWLSLPRGAMGRLCDVFGRALVECRVLDRRNGGEAVKIPAHRRLLYPHQERIVSAALEREQCLIRSGTGSGKTSALIAIASRLQVSTVVVVHSRGLFDQWAGRLREELGLRDRDIGVIRGKIRKLRPVTLAVMKSMSVAAQEPAVQRYFGCVMFDEVHGAGAPSAYACVDPMPARYRFGASADHRRKDRKECLIHDLFGDVAVNVSHEELVAGGYVMDVEVRCLPTDFQAPWYGVPTAESPDVEVDFVRLVQEMAACPRRNEIALGAVGEEVQGGGQVLVMAHEREHCMRLGQALHARGVRVGYLLGGDESLDEFRSTIDGLRRGTKSVGVGTYKSIGSGIDLPKVSATVAVTPIAANEQTFTQVRGRVCRTADGKTAARLYVVLDAEVYPRHLANVARWNKRTVVWDGSAWVGARNYVDRRRA